MAATYESVLCVKNEIFVYKIPARTSNRGYRAADWTLDKPDWVGRLKAVAKGESLFLRLEDKNSGELFAQCPVDAYPGPAIEQVLDSSRYFVIRIKDDSGRSAFIGIGFADRGDSFDLLVAMQDHFKWLKRESDREKEEQDALHKLNDGPKLDLSFKEGQTIKINLNTKRQGDEAESAPAPSGSKPRARSQGAGSMGILPPPPGGAKILPPPRAPTAVAAMSQGAGSAGGVGSLDLLGGHPQQAQNVNRSTGANNLDLLMNLDSSSSTPSATAFQSSSSSSAASFRSHPDQSDPWGDFTSASAASSGNQESSSSTGWVSFE